MCLHCPLITLDRSWVAWAYLLVSRDEEMDDAAEVGGLGFEDLEAFEDLGHTPDGEGAKLELLGHIVDVARDL